MDQPSVPGATRGSASGDADPAAAPSDDLRAQLDELRLTLDAQRQLLRARRPTDLVDTLRAVVHRAGATLVDGEVTGPEVLQIDVGLGIRPPSLPWSPPDHPSRQLLQRVLPGLVDDAGRVAHRLLEAREATDVSLLDDLTGGLAAEATRRLLDKVHPGDAVVVGTLPTAGSDAYGDLALRALAELFRTELDVDERLCRLDERSLAVAIAHADPRRLTDLTERVAGRWERERTEPLVVGTAVVTSRRTGLAASLVAQLAAVRTAYPQHPGADGPDGVELEFRDTG